VVKGLVEKICTEPAACSALVAQAGDFHYQFFVSLRVLLKNVAEEEIDAGDASNPRKTALMQSLGILNAFLSYYRTKAVAENSKAKAFSEAYSMLADPPYVHTRQDILNMTNKAGVPILADYSDEDVDNFLKEKLTTGEENQLPDLLVFTGPAGENWFVRKDMVPRLTIKLVNDARAVIKPATVKHWENVLKGYRSEPAMYKDRDYEDFIYRLCRQMMPQLLSIARDQKMKLLQQEPGVRSEALPGFFDGDRPVPLGRLLSLSRRQMFDEVRLSLPFWYTIPFIVNIMRIFKYGPNGGKDKPAPATAASANSLRASATKTASQLVSNVKEIPDELQSLENRWNTYTDPGARVRLTKQVQSSIRAFMQRITKIRPLETIDMDALTGFADKVIAGNQELQQIRNKTALNKYIQLFILKQIIG
jgi:hypothetical protein